MTPPPTVLHWPGGGSWDPSQLADLLAWWKFDELTGTNGSSITSVTDSGGSFDLSGSSPAPTLVTPSQNGLNTIDFGPSSANLNSSSAYGGGDDGFSVYVVAKRGNAAVNQHVSGGSGSGHLLGSNSSASVWVRAYKSDGSRYEKTNVGGWSGGWDIVGFSADFVAGTFDVYQDGSSIDSQTGLATGTSQTHTFLIGTFGGAGHWQGELGEELIVNNALSTTDREKIEGYLAHKWGLTANLPVSHPYKSTAP